MENLKKLGFGCMRLPMLDVENNKGRYGAIL